MDWTYNTLWTDQLPANTYRSVDLKVGQRHYNYDEKEVEAHFADRGEKARIYVHKGPYRTFTYRGVGDARHN